MPEPIQRVRIEEVDWTGVLPWVRLFRSFSLAFHTPKMLLALLLVILLYAGGRVFDAAWGPGVDAPEALATPVLRVVPSRTPVAPAPHRGVFAVALAVELDGFRRVMTAAINLDFGLESLTAGRTPPADTVAGAMRDMFVEVPTWLARDHGRFSLAYCIYGTLVWTLLAGAIARLTALHATRNVRLPIAHALAYAWSRYFWYLATPLIPLLLCALLAGFMLAGGWLLFRHYTEIGGALLFGFALLAGVLITVMLTLLAASANLIYPALSIEGTDGLDVLSRLFNYVGGRPLRWLFYNLVALVYGAITYLILALVIFMALLITHGCVDAGVTSLADNGSTDRLRAIWPEPDFAKLSYDVGWSALHWSGKIAAALVWVWIFLLVGVLAAYAINYYIASNTWIYLLLRRSADGTEFDEVFMPKSDAPAAPAAASPQVTLTPDEVEAPEAPAAPAASHDPPV
jgi:hypothetical protein